MRYLLGLGLVLLSTGVFAKPTERTVPQIQELKKQVDKAPQSETLRLQLTQAYLNAKQYQPALIELDKIRQSGADIQIWGVTAAKIYMGLERYQEAIVVLNELDGTMDPVERALLLAESFLMSRNFEQARKYYQSVILNNHPKAMLGLAQVALFEGDIETAQNQILSAKQAVASDNIIHPETISLLHHFQAEIYRLEQKNEAAETEYLKAIEADEENMLAKLHYASFLLSMLRMDDFIKQAGQLYQRMPLHSLAMYYQAVANLEQSKTAQAQKILLEGIKRHPKFAENYLLLARIYFETQQYMQAEQQVKIYNQLRPAHVPATKLLAAIYIRQNRAQDALDILTPLEQSQNQDANVMSLYGTALLLNKQSVKAQKILKQAEALSEGHPVIATELAISHLSQGEHEKAQKLLQKIVDQNDHYIQADMLLIMSLVQSKSYTRAEEAIKKLIAKNPKRPGGYNLLGMLYEHKKQYDAAKEQYVAALKIEPTFLLAQNNLSELYVYLEEYEQAKRQIAETLQQEPQNLRALLLMGLLQEKLGSPKQAITWYQQAKTYYPDQVSSGIELINYYLRQGDLDTAEQEADAILLKFPKSTIALSKAASIKTALKKNAEAIKIYESWQTVDKSNPAIDYMLAKLSLALNQKDKAVHHIAAALKKNAQYAPALILQAQMHLAQSDWEKAEQVVNQLAQAAPNKDYTYLLQGKVLYAKGAYSDSLIYFEKAYALRPSFEHVTAYSDGLVALQKPDAAFALLEGWIEKHPKHMGARRFTAAMAIQMGQQEKARRYYEEMITISKGDFVTYNNLAYLYVQQDLEKALEYANKAYALAPDQAKVIDTLGWILVLKQEPIKALPLLEQAYRLAPNEPDIQYHLAEALYQLGSRKESYALIKTTLDTYNLFSERKQAAALLDKLKLETSSQ